MFPFRLLSSLVFTVFFSLAYGAPLSFNAAIDIAEQHSPSIAVNGAEISAAQSVTVSASALPDPKLVTGIDNYPVTGSEAGRFGVDFMTMQRFGVMQEVPNTNKREARNEVAVAAVEVAKARQRVSQLIIRRAVALAWINCYYLERKLSLFDELVHENELLRSVVKAKIRDGRTLVSDALLPDQEAVQLDDQRDDLSRDLEKSRAELRHLVGNGYDGKLAGSPPVLIVDADHFRQNIMHHPELLAFAAETHRAEAEVHEATALKHSDWSVELDYERRAQQFGDMVSVQFTFELPLSPATRQDPLIAAKQQELVRIDAEREGVLRDHINELENDLADYRALQNQLKRAQQVALPLAQEKVKLLTISYQASKADLSSVLSARRELVDLRFKIIDLESQCLSMAAKLYFSHEESLS
jgi:outer membrane protein TolC